MKKLTILVIIVISLMLFAFKVFETNPATIMEGKRKGERTLANEEDFGLQLINSLSEDQKKIAIFQKTAYEDLVTSNATEVAPLQPIGIKMGDLKSKLEMEKLMRKIEQNTGGQSRKILYE